MIKKIQKRLIGINIICLIVLIGSSSSSINYYNVCKNEHIILNGHLIKALSMDNALEEEKDMTVHKITIERKKTLKDRYSNIKQYAYSDFLNQFIIDNSSFIAKKCDQFKVNASIVNAVLIIENIDAANETYGILALKHHNWGNIKVKSGKYYSKSFKTFLKTASNGTVFVKDDCGEDKCEFYTFKNDQLGIEANIRFIADRINSQHKNYIGKFNFDISSTEKWAYGIYDSGYANKNTSYPYDKKLMRIVQQYQLDKVYGY